MTKTFYCRAVILDMDGVITQTADIHAEAWKQMFDDFLRSQNSSSYRPLDINHDYKVYIDGKPRSDGLKSFLQSRSITLPEGSPDDKAEINSVYGLAKRKNKIFLKLLEERGVHVYDDTVEKLKEWQGKGIKLGAITSSKNGRHIIESAGLTEMFDVMIDGITSEELSIKGKPEPDIFVKAADKLGVTPPEAVVIEDAVSGVAAGKKGRFGLVIGVARNGDRNALLDAGADIVVTNLKEVKMMNNDKAKQINDLPDALEEIDKIKSKIRNRKTALFLDYDGTLTPIVNDPEKALLDENAKKILNRIASAHIVAVVSGRDRMNVKEKVGIENIYYAGSHGFDITGPGGLELQNEDGMKIIPDLDKAEKNLKDKLKHIKGVNVERKKYAIAVHYRNVEDSKIPEVKDTVYKELEQQHNLKEGKGKKVLELKPAIDWHKGKAIGWLKESLNINDDEYFTIFIGDDVTDEDAFKAVYNDGIGIITGSHNQKTYASYSLKDTGEVLKFLGELLK